MHIVKTCLLLLEMRKTTYHKIAYTRINLRRCNIHPGRKIFAPVNFQTEAEVLTQRETELTTYRPML